jgi:hypothetical protein
VASLVSGHLVRHVAVIGRTRAVFNGGLNVSIYGPTMRECAQMIGWNLESDTPMMDKISTIVRHDILIERKLPGTPRERKQMHLLQLVEDLPENITEEKWEELRNEARYQFIVLVQVGDWDHVPITELPLPIGAAIARYV